MSSLVSGGAFQPHGYCLAWDPFLVGADVIASALIALAYFSIPLTLTVFVRRNPTLHFNGLFAMFSLFIFACGAGHVVDIFSLWIPVYRLELSVKAITAAASVATALTMWPLLPKATALLREYHDTAASLRRVNAELQASHDALIESNERFRLTLQNAPIGFAHVALDGSFLSVNSSLCEMLGYAEGQLLMKTFQDITHPDDLDQDLAYVAQLLGGERISYRMQKRYFHRFGHIVYIQLDVSLVRSADGRPLHFISQIQDITRRIEQERALEQRALTDDLTGLPNRRAFLDAAARLIAQAGRGGSVGLLMIDLDHFKDINDTRGHASGDQVLRAMKDIVGPMLRASDLFARLGGEEFAVLLPNSSMLHAREVAERLRRTIETAGLRSADGRAVPLTASFGVTASEGKESIEAIFERADRAMYGAKRAGRNCVVVEAAGDTPATSIA
ncbi:sensor domain-containing diguanylate cyclase [Solimonas soli]|uniref:sensor domain-containing diguanylate cyclase n=1 Tax=Solimonas soli TaxID=413479 RepID=UPI00146FA60F|nr:GGDEF domain-containing protein [Solimonas soli]